MQYKLTSILVIGFLVMGENGYVHGREEQKNQREPSQVSVKAQRNTLQPTSRFSYGVRRTSSTEQQNQISDGRSPSFKVRRGGSTIDQRLKSIRRSVSDRARTRTKSQTAKRNPNKRSKHLISLGGQPSKNEADVSSDRLSSHRVPQNRPSGQKEEKPATPTIAEPQPLTTASDPQPLAEYETKDVTQPELGIQRELKSSNPLQTNSVSEVGVEPGTTDPVQLPSQSSHSEHAEPAVISGRSIASEPEVNSLILDSKHTAAVLRPESTGLSLSTAPLTNDLSKNSNNSVSDELAASVKPSDDQALFRSRSPNLQISTVGPRTIVVGKESTFVVSVVNMGTSTANELTIEVSLPSGADIIQQQPSVGHARLEPVGDEVSRVRWDINRVGRNSEETLELRLIPRNSHPFDLAVNWTFNPEVSVAQIEVKEPKLEVLLSGPSDILYGESKVYTITVRNPGTGDAENVVLNLLPINQQDASGVRRLGTLKAGHSERIDVELTAQQPGQIWIRAQAYGENGLRAEVAEEVLVRRANLEVTVEAPDVKYAGTVAQYDVRIANTGDAMAENVIVTAMLPQGAEFVNGGDDVEYDPESGRITWTCNGMNPGTYRTIRLKAVLGTPGSNRLEIVAEAADDLASFQSAVTLVEAQADLKLVINDPRGPVPVGDEAIFEVRLVNRGTKLAEAIRAYAFFSEGIDPLKVVGGKASIEPGQVVFEEIEHIGPGQEILYKILAKASVSGNHIFRVEVTCEDPKTDLAAQETTKFYGEIVLEEEKEVSDHPNGKTTIRR